MRIPPSRFFSCSLAMLLLIDAGGAKVPTGVFVMKEESGDHPARVEFSGGKDAFLWSEKRLIAATVTEVEGLLRLQLPGGKAGGMTFSTDGGDLLDQDKNRWVPRERIVKVDPAWTPLEISVKDQHGRALGEFSYRYAIEAAGVEWDPLLVRPLKAEAGKIRIIAPAECGIPLEIDHPDRVRGYGTLRTTTREAGQATQGVELELGRKVTGNVVEEVTGKPVAGAVVSPSIFTPPGFSPDRGRSVITGDDGRFELRGVGSCGVAVEHSDYVEENVFLNENEADTALELRLKAGETIRGIVHGPGGKTLGGVKVTDGSGKKAVTGEDGAFVLRGLRKWSGNEWWLGFSKEGFNDHDFRAKEIGPEGVEVGLKPLPEFRGRVIMPDGTPARRFRMACGPGTNPADFHSVTIEVDDPEGRFAVKPDREAEKGTDYWIGARAEGAAPWDGVVSSAELEDGGYRITLARGVGLMASLALPASATGPLEVTLEPRDRQPEEKIIVTTHPGQALASYQSSLKPGEPLRFSHLRAGDYELKIRGEGATPVVRRVTLKDKDLDLGVLRLAGTGTISGIVTDPHDPKKAWGFADGEIHVKGFGEGGFDPYMKFKTDAAGKFRVEGVPAGTVEVSFPYNVSADIIDALTREVKMAEGKETEVRIGKEK